MKQLLLVLALAACGGSQPGNGSDRGWVCKRLTSDGADTSMCYRTRDDCLAARTPPGWIERTACIPEAIAYCPGAVDSSAAPDTCYATPEDCARSYGAPQCAAFN